jgi:hypothetical protein
LTLENLALRQQLAMLKPSVKRPQVKVAPFVETVIIEN